MSYHDTFTIFVSLLKQPHGQSHDKVTVGVKKTHNKPQPRANKKQTIPNHNKAQTMSYFLCCIVLCCIVNACHNPVANKTWPTDDQYIFSAVLYNEHMPYHRISPNGSASRRYYNKPQVHKSIIHQTIEQYKINTSVEFNATWNQTMAFLLNNYIEYMHSCRIMNRAIHVQDIFIFNDNCCSIRLIRVEFDLSFSRQNIYIYSQESLINISFISAKPCVCGLT